MWSLLSADADSVEAECGGDEVDGVAEVDPDDVGGAQQEERGRRQRSAANDVRLHCPLPVEGSL